MWLTQKLKELLKLVNVNHVYHFIFEILLLAMLIFGIIDLKTRLKEANDNMTLTKAYIYTKMFFLENQVDSLTKVNDSLTIELKKVTWLKEQPLIPAFEMNSKLGEVYQGIEQTGIRCPEAMFALACHETGRFTSKLARYNNYFGLAWSKHPLVIGKVWSEGDGHYKAVFNSPQDCFTYMKEWQMRKQGRLDFSSNSRFIHSLKRVNYATHPDHGKIVLKTMNDLFDVKSLNDFIEEHNQVEKFLAIN